MQTDRTASENVVSVPASRVEGRSGGVSIGFILSLLMAAIIVPALIFALVLLQRNNEAQQTMVSTLAEATAASITQTLERQISGMVTTLRAFSTTQTLQRGDIAEFHRRAAEALEGSGKYLVGVDENFHQVFNTRVPFGTPLGDVSNVETAQRALASGQPVVTDVFMGRATQKWVFNVMIPTPDPEGPIRLLLLSQPVDELDSAISTQYLRGGWNAVIVDGKGVVAASSFMSSDVGKPFLLGDSISQTSDVQKNTVGVEGQTFETIRAYSEISGWQIVVWAPTSVVRAPMVNIMRSLALGGLAIIAIGAILAWILGRQIARPIRSLARDARRLGAGEEVVAVDYAVAEIATVSQALAQASHERHEAENEIRFLMREVAHRSKNQLTVVSSIAKQTARHARTFAAFQDAFQKRIQGLARSTDLLIAGGVVGVELHALVETQIAPFRPSDDSRVAIAGTPFRLSNQAAQTLGLALHELATNAAKYGAFAVAEGRLTVNWQHSPDELEFVWREFVPRLRRRTGTRGFGTEVIERMLGGTMEAQIERTFHRDGLECRVVMPLSRLQPDGADQQDG